MVSVSISSSDPQLRNSNFPALCLHTKCNFSPFTEEWFTELFLAFDGSKMGHFVVISGGGVRQDEHMKSCLQVIMHTIISHARHQLLL